jgi:type I restriction enzyme S subunit
MGCVMNEVNEHNKNVLPKGWTLCKLLDIGKIISGGTPSTKEPDYWGDEVEWITPADLSGYSNKFISKGRKSITKKGLQSSSAKLLPKGAVLFSSRAPIGYVVIAANDLCTNQGFKNIVPNSYVNNEYLYYYLKASKHLAEKHASGTTFKEISASKFSELPIPVPPIEEQKQIVSKIEELFSELDKSIEQLKTAQQQLKVYRQSVLKCAFEGYLTADWRNENLNIESVTDYLKRCGVNEIELAESSDITQTWRKIRLDYLCQRVSVGHVGPTSQFYTSKESGIPFIRSQNVRKGYLDFEGLQFITKEFHNKLKKSQLQAGDLLIVRVGANRGDACVVPDNIGEINCANIVFARPHKGISKFLGYFFISPYWKDLVEEITTGSAQGVVNTKIVAETIVTFPPIEEQNQIVFEIEKLFSVSDKVGEILLKSIQNAETLRQSILKNAFEGRLL